MPRLMKPLLPPEHPLYCSVCCAFVTSHLWRKDGHIEAICQRCGAYKEVEGTRLTVPLDQIPTRKARIDGRQDDLFPLHGKGKP